MRTTREFLASVSMPARAAALMGAVGVALTAAVLYAQGAAVQPLDVTWLYSINFLLVYGIQVGPVLFFGLCSLRSYRPYPWHPPVVRFVCLVPAYNEERVIQNSVGSLMCQDYPEDLFDVYVVSDGSGDRTEEIARRLGARVLRTGVKGFGKHRALGHAIERLLRPDDDRYVCVIDADNVVAPNFLQAMNNAICATGARCLQSFHDCLNGSDNWITKGLWLTTVASSRLYNRGRSHITGVSLICGTGWCCEGRLLRTYWPLIRTQTEDIELTGLLLLHEGIGIPWVAETRVYDEKPLNLWVAIRQRHRWMTGHMRVAALLAWPCLREGIRRRDARLIELALYYVLPFVMNVSNVQLLLLLGLHLGILALRGPLAVPALRAAVNELTLLYLFGYQVLGLGLHTGLWGRGALYTVYAAVFSLLAWTPALVWACFTVFRKDWIFHTPHVAGVAPGQPAAAAMAGGNGGQPHLPCGFEHTAPVVGVAPRPGATAVSRQQPAR